MNEATLQRRRGKMMLPAPQISDAELEALARQGGELGLDPELAGGRGILGAHGACWAGWGRRCAWVGAANGFSTSLPI